MLQGGIIRTPLDVWDVNPVRKILSYFSSQVGFCEDLTPSRTKLNIHNLAGPAILGAILLFVPATVSADMSNSPWAAEQMWGNGTLWQMMAPPANVGNAASQSQEPLYIIAPQDLGNPQAPASNDHLPGVAHDHVISVPPNNHGTYSAVRHVYVVGCKPTAITSGNCTPYPETFPNGHVVPLARFIDGSNIKSDSVINSALANGYIFLIDTGVVFLCPVQQAS